MILAIVGLLLQTQATQVQMGTSITPETVTVGQHFSATLRVRAPAGSDLRFPARTDSTSRVDTVSAPTRSDANGAGFTEATVRYILAAWDTGAQRLGLDDVVVANPAGERIASLQNLRVVVRSVLPHDTALRKPKPYRALMAVRTFDWRPWAMGAAVLALAALLAYLWYRWRMRSRIPLTALQRAEREFMRIESQRMIESGETERFAIEMSGVMREYLARAVPGVRTSATTRELGAALMQNATAAPLHKPLHNRIIALLERIDLLKFAAERTTPDAARSDGAEARAIVTDVDARLREAALLAERRAA